VPRSDINKRGFVDLEASSTKPVRRRGLFRRKAEVEPAPEDKPRADFNPVPLSRVFGYARPEWYLLAFGTVASLFTGAMRPSFAYIFAGIIASFYNDPANPGRPTTFWSYMFLLIAGVALLANFFQVFLFGTAGARLTQRIRALAFASVLKQETGWFDRDE
jgi:ABC-type multidrug transport system fused ATPase/permease subunit